MCKAQCTNRKLNENFTLTNIIHYPQVFFKYLIVNNRPNTYSKQLNTAVGICIYRKDNSSTYSAHTENGDKNYAEFGIVHKFNPMPIDITQQVATPNIRTALRDITYCTTRILIPIDIDPGMNIAAE